MVIIFSLEELLLYLVVQNFWTLLIADQLLFRSLTKTRLVAGCVTGTFLELIGIRLMISSMLTGTLKWIILLLIAILSIWMIAGITYRVVNWKGKMLVMSKLVVISSLIGAGYTAMETVTGSIFACQLLMLITFCSAAYGGIRCHAGRAGSNRNICAVRIEGKIQKVYKGLWDTGNLLTEPVSHWPVCIIKKKYLRNVMQKDSLCKMRAIPYQTVNGDRKIMFGFPMEYMEVEKEGIVVGVSKIYLAATEMENELSDYDILLPYHIFDRREKGCL